MNRAATRLRENNRTEALPAEEGALAQMYQVLRLVPELENFPTSPSLANQPAPASPKLKVVLEAIQQRQKEDSTNQEIQEALDKAKELAKAQSALNSALRHPGSDSSKASGSESPNSSGGQPATASATGQSDSPSPEASQETFVGWRKANGRERESPQRGGSASGREVASPGRPELPTRSKAPEITPGQAASKMAAAGQAMGQGNLGLASQQGVEGEVALHGVISRLERFLKNQPEPSDIATEDFPKAYEALISEYLKQLSHAE